MNRKSRRNKLKTVSINRKKVTPKRLSDDEVLKLNAAKGKVGIIELKDFPLFKKQIDLHLERAKQANDVLKQATDFKAKAAVLLENVSKKAYKRAKFLKRFGVLTTSYKSIEAAEDYQAKEKELRKRAERFELQNAAAVNAIINCILEFEGVAGRTFSFQKDKIIVNLI